MIQFSNQEAERACISAAVHDARALDKADLAPEDFRHPARQQLWATLHRLRASGRAIDEVTLLDAIMSHEQPLRSEWIECASMLVTWHNVDHYAAIVREHALTRRVLQTLGELVADAKAGRAAGEALLGTATTKLAQLAKGQTSRTKSMAALLKAMSDRIDDAYARRQDGEDVVTGVPTGIEKLDKMGGVGLGVPTLIAGRPGMGKSALAQCITAHAADNGIGVHVFSFEDTEFSYTARALARETKVPVTRIKGGQLQRGDMFHMPIAMGRMAKWSNFGYEDLAGATAAQVVAAVRRERDRLQTRLVVVDYIQRMRKPDRRMNKQEALEHNLWTMAEAALADDIAYLVLSQLNRNPEARNDKRPEMADLRGAGELEEYAKAVWLVHRPGYYDESADQNVFEVLVEKNNDGPTGKVTCTWDGPCTRVS